MGTDGFGKGGPVVPVRAIAAYLAKDNAGALEIVSWQHRRPSIVDHEPAVRRLRGPEFRRVLQGHFTREVPYALESGSTHYATRGLHYLINRELRLGGEPNCVLNFDDELSVLILRSACDDRARYHLAGLQMVIDGNVAGVNGSFKPDYKSKRPRASKFAYVALMDSTIIEVEITQELWRRIISGRDAVRELLAKKN